MSFHSILAAAVPRGFTSSFVERQAAGAGRRACPRERLGVIVAGRDAAKVRRALLACPGAAVMRCVPMHREDRVKLEIGFPAGQADTVIDEILACLPQGEIGSIAACRRSFHGQ